MSNNEAPWDDDITFLRNVSEQNDVVVSDEMEDDYCYEVWALWNEGLPIEEARKAAYDKIINGVELA